MEYKTITKPDGKEDVDAVINVVKKAQKCSDVKRKKRWRRCEL